MIPADRAVLLLVVGASAFAPTASAHGEADWLHEMLDGAVLFFTALGSLLPVFMVALLARSDGLRHVTIHAAALGIGLLIVLVGLPVAGEPSAVGLYARGYLIALGLVVLFNLRLHSGLALALVVATGALTGFEAAHGVVGGPATGFATALGFVFSAISLFLPVALIASRYPEGWQRIAIRVVASWIAAIAAIDIAFMIVRSG